MNDAIAVGHWLYQGFCLPGDYLLSTYAPMLEKFIELPTAPGSTMAGVIAGVVWLSALILIVRVGKWIHDAYIIIAGYGTRGQQALLRIVRNVSRRLRIAGRGFRLGPKARIAPTISEQVELGELEFAALRCLGALPSDRRLTAEEAASELDVRVSQARKALQSLVLLRLIDGTTASGGKEVSRYRLTRYGQGFLTASAQTPLALPHRA